MPAHCAPAKTRPRGLTLAARFCDTEFYLIKLSGKIYLKSHGLRHAQLAHGLKSQVPRGARRAPGTGARGARVGAGVRGAEVSALSYFALPYGSHWLSLTAWLLALHVVSCRFRPFRIFGVTGYMYRGRLRLRRGRPQHLIIRRLTFLSFIQVCPLNSHRDEAEHLFKLHAHV